MTIRTSSISPVARLQQTEVAFANLFSCSLQVQQLQGVYNLQEPHFWTLCTDVYIGTLKLLVAPDADSRWILSQTHNIFTQVGTVGKYGLNNFILLISKFPLHDLFCPVPRLASDNCMFRLTWLPCRSPPHFS